MKIWIAPNGRSHYNTYWDHWYVNYRYVRNHGLLGVHDTDVDIYLPDDCPDDISDIAKLVTNATIHWV